MMEQVVADYVRNGHDYKKTHDEYAKELNTELEAHGGNLSDLPITSVATQKLNALHSLHKSQGLPIVKKVPVAGPVNVSALNPWGVVGKSTVIPLPLPKTPAKINPNTPLAKLVASGHSPVSVPVPMKK